MLFLTYEISESGSVMLQHFTILNA